MKALSAVYRIIVPAALMFLAVTVTSRAQPAGSVTHEDTWSTQRLMEDASRKLGELSARQVPRGFSDSLAQRSWREQSALLDSIRLRLDALQASRSTAMQDRKLTDAERANVNRCMLALQEATQMESRRFQSATGELKTRHDIALNIVQSLLNEEHAPVMNAR